MKDQQGTWVELPALRAGVVIHALVEPSDAKIVQLEAAQPAHEARIADHIRERKILKETLAGGRGQAIAVLRARNEIE